MVFPLHFLMSSSFGSASAQALTKMKANKKDGWGGPILGGKPKSSLRDEKFHIFWICYGKTASQERQANDCIGAFIEHAVRRRFHTETPWLEFARTDFPYILTPGSTLSLNNHDTEDVWPPLSRTQSCLIFLLLVSFLVLHKKHLVAHWRHFLWGNTCSLWQSPPTLGTDGFATSKGSTQHNN